MNVRLKEYQSWYLENNAFFQALKSHHSVLYTRLQPVYDVLYYLYNENKDVEYIDEDIDKIIQVGLEFLHQQIFTCKTYYQQFFDQDIHAFLKYDHVVNDLLFIEDLNYELVEQNIDYDKKMLDGLSEELESMITDKLEVPENLNLYVDKRLSEIVTMDHDYFHSIIDIFVEIGSTLGLDFDQEDDYVIGKDF
jgi:hypothetical protein